MTTGAQFSIQLTITKKMAACTFYQNALHASSKTTEKRYHEKHSRT